VVSARTAETLRKILEGAVVRGTGREARLNGWSSAGKTGTAQKLDPATGLYAQNRYVASFIGFAPVDRPRLTIVVIFDEPRGLGWGGYNAGPVFKRIAQYALTYLGVPSDAEAAPGEAGAGKRLAGALKKAGGKAGPPKKLAFVHGVGGTGLLPAHVFPGRREHGPDARATPSSKAQIVSER
jgi:membrane peptidoglycan carboxypeptidase